MTLNLGVTHRIFHSAIHTMASRRVVNVDSGSSGSLSSRFANIEKSAPKQKPATRAVQAVPTSRPVSGGVNKRGQQSPRGGARNGPAKSLAAVRGGAAPRGRPSGRGAPRGGALRGGSVRGGGRGGRGRGGRGGARGGKKGTLPSRLHWLTLSRFQGRPRQRVGQLYVER